MNALDFIVHAIMQLRGARGFVAGDVGRTKTRTPNNGKIGGTQGLGVGPKTAPAASHEAVFSPPAQKGHSLRKSGRSTSNVAIGRIRALSCRSGHFRPKRRKGAVA